MASIVLLTPKRRFISNQYGFGYQMPLGRRLTRKMVKTIGDIIGYRRSIIPVPPSLGCGMGYVISKLTNDVFITRAEIEGLMADLLYVDSAPTGQTKLTDWISKHAKSLGVKYTSELARRRNRVEKYQSN